MNTGSLVNDVLVIVESKVILLKDAKIILLGTAVTTRETFVVGGRREERGEMTCFWRASSEVPRVTRVGCYLSLNIAVSSRNDHCRQTPSTKSLGLRPGVRS